MERRRPDPQAVPGADTAARRDPAATTAAAGLLSAGRGNRRHQGSDAGTYANPAGDRSADLVEQARRRQAPGQHAALHPATVDRDWTRLLTGDLPTEGRDLAPGMRAAGKHHAGTLQQHRRGRRFQGGATPNIDRAHRARATGHGSAGGGAVGTAADASRGRIERLHLVRPGHAPASGCATGAGSGCPGTSIPTRSSR